MFIYGRTSSNAIALMSYLAALPEGRAGSAEIASARDLSTALTAKLLTQLASAGLVAGKPGPSGGYKLARPAGRITLLDIISVFEQTNTPSACPFGQHWCGSGDPCPLHNEIVELLETHQRFTEETTLSVFTNCKQGKPNNS